MEALRLFDYTASANCMKVRLLLAQLERDYERVPVDIFAGETLTDEFAAINPARATPVLQIGSDRYLSESNAILVYLAEGTPLLPGDPYGRADVIRWLIVEQGDVMMPFGGLRFRLQTGRWQPDQPDALRRRRHGEETMALLDAHLARHEFLVGAYSIADVAVYAYTHVAHEAGFEVPFNVARWLRSVEATPRFVNDLEPYPPNARPGAGRSVYDG